MKKLYRSRTNMKIAGVCGGLGELMDIDPTMVRLAVVILGLATGIVPFLSATWWRGGLFRSLANDSGGNS